MASVEKFSMQAVRQQLRHIERETQTPSNQDIDPTRSHLNYALHPERGIHSYDYFLKRMNELHYLKRSDLRPMAGWVVTLPDDVSKELEADFFSCVYHFLCERYGGEENCVSCCVHYDESGQAHLHYYFIPTAKSEKHGLKVSAKECLTRTDLRNFHPDLKHYLDEHGIKSNKVYSGITKRNGGNRSVREIKRESPLDRVLARQHNFERGR